MSYTQEDADRDAFYEKLYDELGPQWAEDHADEIHAAHYTTAIAAFTIDRLQSYYRAHPDLVKNAYEALEYARSLTLQHPRAALVFAATAIELGLRTAILKPILYGLVHNEALADVVLDILPTAAGIDRFKPLLFGILSRIAGIDFAVYRRATSPETLWQEIDRVQRARNAVIHRGEIPVTSDVTLSINTAEAVLSIILPELLLRLGLCACKHAVTGDYLIETIQLPS